jgi:pimeloyl-ACP methyl ester carboxylesterase
MATTSEPGRREDGIGNAACGAPGRAPRFVLFLGGLQSHSQQTPDDHAVREDFHLLRARLETADPALRFLTFSYGAGPRIAKGDDPRQAWVGDYEQGEPLYSAVETTDRPLADQVAGLDWLLRDLLGHYPNARIDLIGFSLGGIIALSWAAEVASTDPMLAAIHRIVAISSPVGGISSLGSLTPKPGIRHALARFRVEFGQSLVFRDLRTDSPAIAALHAAPGKVDVASVENSRDYLVNGRRITGQRLLPIWVRTIPLGRGAAVSEFLPREQCYVDDLDGWEQHLRTTHQHIMRGESPAIERARQHIVGLVLTDGPIWTAHQARESTPQTVILTKEGSLSDAKSDNSESTTPYRGDASCLSMTRGNGRSIRSRFVRIKPFATFTFM